MSVTLYPNLLIFGSMHMNMNMWKNVKNIKNGLAMYNLLFYNSIKKSAEVEVEDETLIREVWNPHAVLLFPNKYSCVFLILQNILYFCLVL